MRILNLGGGMLVSALRKLGHEVLTVNFDPHADIVVRQPFFHLRLQRLLAAKGFIPNVLFYCDNGNLPLLLDPQNVPWPNVWYSIDTYCNPWHIPYANGFDLSFVAQKDFLALFTQEELTAQWLPLFCPHPLANSAEEGDRDIPVAFVGTVKHSNNPDRQPFLRAFRRKQPLVMLSGDYVPIFRRACIVLNQTAFSEVNFRCFEAMACGAALLMENCANGLSELFTPGEEILPLYMRNDATDAARIAALSLAKSEKLREIAIAGQQVVLMKHTALARAATVAEVFTCLLAQQVHTIRLAQEQERRTALVRGAFGVLATDFCGPQWDVYRNFYLDAASGCLSV